MGYLITCKWCNKSMSSNIVFCPHCGVSKNEYLVYCPTCNKKMFHSSSSCPHCGETDFWEQETETYRVDCGERGYSRDNDFKECHGRGWYYAKSIKQRDIPAGSYDFDATFMGKKLYLQNTLMNSLRTGEYLVKEINDGYYKPSPYSTKWVFYDKVICPKCKGKGYYFEYKQVQGKDKRKMVKSV